MTQGQKRVMKLKELLEKKDIAASFVSKGEDVYYLSDVCCVSGVELQFIPREGDSILWSRFGFGADKVEAETWIRDVRVLKDRFPSKKGECMKGKHGKTLIEEIIEEHRLGEKKMGLDPYEPSLVKCLRKEFPKAEFVDMSKDVLNMRMFKSNEEIDFVKKAIEITEKAIESLWSSIEEGVSEAHLAAKAYCIMKEGGSSGLGMTDFAFPIIVASGPNSANGHHPAGDRKVRRGDFVKIDIGARYRGYCADITRTAVFGKPSEKQRKMHQTVITAQQKIIDGLEPGANPNDVLWPGFATIKESGYFEYIAHGVGGHGIGLKAHEPPLIVSLKLGEEGFLGSWVRPTIMPRWIFTIEPGIYIPRYGGVRIEDDVLITEKGHEVLSSIDRSIDAINR